MVVALVVVGLHGATVLSIGVFRVELYGAHGGEAEELTLTTVVPAAAVVET